jgi:hypothetical protein
MVRKSVDVPKSKFILNKLNFLSLNLLKINFKKKKIILGENPAAYGAGVRASVKNQSIYVQTFLLFIATYQFIFIQHIS